MLISVTTRDSLLPLTFRSHAMFFSPFALMQCFSHLSSSSFVLTSHLLSYDVFIFFCIPILWCPHLVIFFCVLILWCPHLVIFFCVLILWCPHLLIFFCVLILWSPPCDILFTAFSRYIKDRENVVILSLLVTSIKYTASTRKSSHWRPRLFDPIHHPLEVNCPTLVYNIIIASHSVLTNTTWNDDNDYVRADELMGMI